MRSCARCSKPVRSPRQRYCAEHHAEAQRDHRGRQRSERDEFYAAKHREAKAQRYVSFIWSVLSDANRVDAETVNVLRCLTPKGWELLAKEAREDAPSEATRLRIIEIVTQRVRDARWGFDHAKEVA